MKFQNRILQTLGALILGILITAPAYAASESVVYNGENLGEIGRGQEVHLMNGHIAFVNSEGHVIYDGDDLGKGSSIQIEGDNYAFIDDQGRLIYNGDDLGKLYSVDQGFDLVEGHISYIDYAGKRIYDDDQLASGRTNYSFSGDSMVYNKVDDGIVMVYLDGQKIGAGINPIIAGDNLAYIQIDGNLLSVIYNGDLIGSLRGSTKSPGRLVMNQSHIAFETIDGSINYDGKDLGEGWAPELYGDSIAYLTPVPDDESYLNNEPKRYSYDTILNGENLGKIRDLAVSGEDVAYIDIEDRVIYKNINFGPGTAVYLDKNWLTVVTPEPGTIIENTKNYVVDESGDPIVETTSVPVEQEATALDKFYNFMIAVISVIALLMGVLFYVKSKSFSSKPPQDTQGE